MASVQDSVMVEPRRIEVREFNRPQINADKLLLKIERTGICGSDKHLYAGHMGLQFPVVPSHELVGTIEELGTNAMEHMAVVGGPVREGDRITTTPSSTNYGRCYYLPAYAAARQPLRLRLRLLRRRPLAAWRLFAIYAHDQSLVGLQNTRKSILRSRSAHRASRRRYPRYRTRPRPRYPPYWPRFGLG